MMLTFEAITGLGEPAVAVRRSGHIEAEPQAYVVHRPDQLFQRVGSWVEAEQPTLRVACQDPPVAEHLEARWTTAGVANRLLAAGRGIEMDDPTTGQAADRLFFRFGDDIIGVMVTQARRA